MDAKRCTKCGEVKAIEDFHFRNKAAGLRSSWCKDCKNAKSRDDYWSHPELSRLVAREYRNRNIEACRSRARIKYRENPEPQRGRVRERARRVRASEDLMSPSDREAARAERAARSHEYYIKRKSRILRGSSE